MCILITYILDIKLFFSLTVSGNMCLGFEATDSPRGDEPQT